MEEEKIKFQDDSGDKEFFTIIPNIIVNGYSLQEGGVYLYIKKKAGEDGEFYETKKEACKKLGITYPTLKKILKTLEKDGRIKYVGKKVFKTSPVDVYRIINIWPENIAYYKRELKNKHLSSEKGKESEKISTPESEKISTQRRTNIKEEPNGMQSKALQPSNGKEINEMIGLFKLVNPFYQKLFNMPPQRKAIEELLEKFGREKLEALLKALPEIVKQPTAPRITTPYQLLTNFGKLGIFLQQQRSIKNKYQIGEVNL